MSEKKKKVLFRISIALNIVLIAVITWGFIKINFVKEQVFLTEVQSSLVELEGLIAYQIDNDWSEPNLVTSKLAGILNGIGLGRVTGAQLGTLSESDDRTLSHLQSKLRQYPHDEIYSLADVTDEDKRNFEEFRKKLREAGFGMQIQISADMGYFIQQVKVLNEMIEVPLK